MEDSFAKILLLHKEVRNSKEYKVIKEIRENEISFRLFLRNYRELKRLLDITEDLHTAIKLGDKEKRNVHNIIMEEITFLLHNYVASAMSLVDNTRRHNQRIYEEKYPTIFKEIQEEIDKRFANNETHQIIQGLRNYTLHRKLPVVGRVMYAYENASNFEAKYSISTDSLLEWDEWKPLAKKKLNELKNLSIEERFIGHLKRDISISQLVTDHHKEVVSFYEWLGNKQKEWHKEDEQKLRGKIKIIEQLEKPSSDKD